MEANDEKMPYGVLNVDCLEAMKKLPDNFIDAVVTDPPYGLSFMGKDWDHGVPGVAFWKEALRITKPGGHMVAFGGSRTYHRLTCAIEDAGWEIRDCLGWLYSSGFPKSMDISKAIDKKFGAEREVVGVKGRSGAKRNCMNTDFKGGEYMETLPASEEAKKWSGWGTCLKPAFEPIVLARKPIEGTVADNVLKYGVGGINIDECRVPTDKPVVIHSPAKETLYDSGHKDMGTWTDDRGRFPANIIHDGSDEVVEVFPDGTGAQSSVRAGIKQNSMFSTNGRTLAYKKREETSTNASRFFYCVKDDNKLSPDFEPIVLARKPLEGTVADNVLKYGVGGLNIDECRVPFESEADKASAKPQGKATSKVGALAGGVENDRERTEFTPKDVDGRFPANIMHDGSDGVLDVFPDNVKGGTWNTTKGARHFNNNGAKTDFENHGADTSTGSAARFFYCAKASKKEKGKDNPHPTVKPIKLMEYLVKLISPKGSLVLDPFMGSGTTGIAALNLGRRFIGIEKEPEYFAVAKKRIEEAFLKSKSDV